MTFPNKTKSLIGATAIIAPALHLITDILEWINNGFTQTQLILNYIAFIPMTWLLLGIYFVSNRKDNRSDWIELTGAYTLRSFICILCIHNYLFS